MPFKIWMFKPSPFNVTLTLQTPTTTIIKGSPKKTYETAFTFAASLRSFGGTENTNNGVLTVENTAVVETWFDPRFTSDARVVTSDGGVYEILGTPENIEMKSQFVRFKIREVKGGA